jgi:hypothetical protein
MIEALPPDEQREVAAFIESKKSAIIEKSSRERMSFQEAKKHVFTTYRDVLEKLAK